MYIARAAYIVRGAALEGTDEGLLAKGRSLCVLPPRTKGIGNRCAIRVLQVDDSSFQVPRAGKGQPKYYLLQLSTLVIDQVQTAADEALRKAVELLLNLRNQVRACGLRTLQSVADDVLFTPTFALQKDGSAATIEWSMHFHEKTYEPSVESDDELPEGLGICFEGSTLYHLPTAVSAEEESARTEQDKVTGNRRTGTGELASLHYEAALITAERLFYKICPGGEFLPHHDRDADRGGVGGSAFDEGGDWDSVKLEGIVEEPTTGGGPKAGGPDTD